MHIANNAISDGGLTHSVSQGMKTALLENTPLESESLPEDAVGDISFHIQAPIPLASQEILQDWYMHGPDYLTNDKVSGKTLVTRMIIDGDFRTRWREYVQSISIDTWQSLGYRFPNNIPSTIDSRGVISRSNEAVFQFFNDPNPASINQLMQTRKGLKRILENPSDEIQKKRRRNILDPVYLANMKHWYHEGYLDPATHTHITGRQLITEFVRSGNFVKHFLEYSRNMDIETIEALGFYLRTSMESHFSLLGILDQGAKLENLLRALGEDDIESILGNMPKEHRRNYMKPIEYLNGLQDWYHEGYLTDEGIMITGRDVILECIQQSGNFTENFRKYIDSLSAQELRRIEVHMYSKFKSIFRHIGAPPNGNLRDLLDILGENYSERIFVHFQQVASKKRLKQPYESLILPPPMKRLSSASTPTPVAQFGSDIPEPLQAGLGLCFLNIEKAVRGTIDLQKSDLGIIKDGTSYFIVFRTQELTTQILQRTGLIEMAIEQGNDLFRARLIDMRSGKASEHEFTEYGLWTPKKTRARK